MSKEYQIVVKTNSYAGNFEREMCAYMTGIVGECEVGSEFIEEEISPLFENSVKSKPDDHGCYRPIALDKDINNFVIFFKKEPTPEQIQIMDERAKLFENERPYRYLDKKFKYLGLELAEETTTITRKTIKA